MEASAVAGQGPFGDGWCASRPVTVNWRVYFNGYTSLKLIPWNACCQAECEAELNGWMNDTDVHEQLKDHPGVETASEGTEPNRFVVVLPSGG